MTDVVAAVVTALSPELKAAVVAAAEAQLATITSQVNQVKAAVQADLPSVVATGTGIEALVKAEVAKLKLDVVSVMPAWMKYVAMAVAGSSALLGVGYVVEHVVLKL